MDISMLFALIGPWIVKIFPSLDEYVKYVGPAFMAFITAMGIFTNLLPEPGHKYPVPDVTDLQTELQGGGGFILKIARFARSMTIAMNWFVATAIYSCFYTFVTTIANLLPKFGKKTPKA